MRQKMIERMIKYYDGQIARLQSDIDTYLDHPVGIGEHKDITGTLDELIAELAGWEEKRHVLDMFFRRAEGVRSENDE